MDLFLLPFFALPARLTGLPSAFEGFVSTFDSTLSFAATSSEDEFFVFLGIAAVLSTTGLVNQPDCPCLAEAGTTRAFWGDIGREKLTNCWAFAVLFEGTGGLFGGLDASDGFLRGLDFERFCFCFGACVVPTFGDDGLEAGFLLA